jgi:hypothetical protein
MPGEKQMSPEERKKAFLKQAELIKGGADIEDIGTHEKGGTEFDIPNHLIVTEEQKKSARLEMEGSLYSRKLLEVFSADQLSAIHHAIEESLSRLRSGEANPNLDEASKIVRRAIENKGS